MDGGVSKSLGHNEIAMKWWMDFIEQHRDEIAMGQPFALVSVSVVSAYDVEVDKAKTRIVIDLAR